MSTKSRISMVLPYMHLFGVQAKTSEVHPSKSEPAKSPKVSTRKASSLSFSQLVKTPTEKPAKGSFADSIKDCLPVRIKPAEQAQPHDVAKAERQPTPAELAVRISAAAERARDSGSIRYNVERISDLTARAKTDHSAGIAAKILKAGAKARNEVSPL